MKKVVKDALGSSFAKSLATPLTVDHYLALIDESLSISDPRGRIVDLDRQTPDSVTLLIEPNDNWLRPAPGQHILFGVDLDGVRHRRCFSIANAPDSARIELSIKRNGDGIVSNFLVDDARRGQLVHLSHPEGEFYAHSLPPKKALLISAGSGITPVMSILRSWIATDTLPDTRFVHYAQTPNDMIYRHEIDALGKAHENLTVITQFTQAGDSRIDARFFDAHLSDMEDRVSWLCGPAGFMKAAEALIAARSGAPIFREQFESTRREAAEGEGDVHFVEADVAASGKNGSLLEVAEQAGLDPAFGCRMGICHACKCRVVEGTVRNLRNNEVREIRDTDIQLCIHAAAGDVAVQL